MITKRLRLLASIWLFVFFSYFIARSTFGFVWDDTPYLNANLHYIAPPLTLSSPDLFRRIFIESFHEPRPLSQIIMRLGVSLFSDGKIKPYFWFAFIGAILGTLAVSFFLVAKNFLKRNIFALFALFVFFSSAPVISGAWEVLSIQAIVPLCICLGLIFYWQISEHKRKIFILPLLALFLIGPMLREFLCFFPILIIFLEIRRNLKPTWLSFIALLAFIYSIFPLFIPQALLFGQFHTNSIFSQGLLGAQLKDNIAGSVPLFWRILSPVKRNMPPNMLNILSPLLLLILLSDCLIMIWRRGRAVLGEVLSIKKILFAREFYASALCSVSIIIAILNISDIFIFSLSICLLFAFYILFYDSFLAFWYILFFLPFLRIFTEPVHLAYPLTALCIIVSVAAENFWLKISEVKQQGAILKKVFIIIMALIIGDGLFTICASFRVTKGIHYGSKRVSEWISHNIPEHSAIIINAIHGEELELYTNKRVDLYYTVKAGIARVAAAIFTPQELQKFIDENHKKRNIYFLDVDFMHTPDRVRYHSHKYVKSHSVDVADLGVIYTLRIRYPYIDPLRALTERKYITFIGPPDLENDFYRGPAQSSALFMREIFAEYHLYLVRGTKVSLWDQNGRVNLVLERYDGFNIIEINGRFFAIPQGEGEFDLNKIWKGSYSKNFVSDSLEDLTKQIDNSFLPKPLSQE